MCAVDFRIVKTHSSERPNALGRWREKVDEQIKSVKGGGGRLQGVTGSRTSFGRT